MPDFTSSPQRAVFAGFLFDMDGTIIDSTDAVIKHWQTIGAELGIDSEVILKTSHGRRSIDVLKEICPQKANWEYIKNMEGLLPKEYGKDASEIPGARLLLESITSQNVPWAIVTSATTPLVTGWLRVLDLPTPETLVVAEDVEIGKPDPSCYLMGKERLGLWAGRGLLVLEDSPAGIRAGKAAGCRVMGLVTSHSIEQILAAKPDWIVRDLRSLKVLGVSENGVELEISDALKID